MDRETIRRDCAEAQSVATVALEGGVDALPAQVERLRTAMTSHVRLLIDVVRGEFATAPPGQLVDIVTNTLTLAEHLLALPAQGTVMDLVAKPQLARLLLLMAMEPEAFGALSEVRALVVGGREVVDAV